MKVHHIGYAVENIKEAKYSFESLGFKFKGKQYFDEKRKINIAFIKNGKYIIELIEPAEANSPVDSILDKTGPSCYHLCYESDDIINEIVHMKEKGFKLLIDIDSAPAIGEGAVVAFLFSRKIGLIEIVQLNYFCNVKGAP